MDLGMAFKDGFQASIEMIEDEVKKGLNIRDIIKLTALNDKATFDRCL